MAKFPSHLESKIGLMPCNSDTVNGNDANNSGGGNNESDVSKSTCPVKHGLLFKSCKGDAVNEQCALDDAKRVPPNINNPSNTSYPMNSNFSNTRMESNIPRSGSESNWIYPSVQQFYNSIKRKGWDSDPRDVPNTLYIHNAVNEKCWSEILEYEKYHFDECDMPKLLKFQGKYEERSPKSLFLQFLGYKAPFDRHDWTVDRCGKYKRYILDFYEGEPMPGKAVGIYIDVRPELGFEGIIDRLRRKWDGIKNKF